MRLLEPKEQLQYVEEVKRRKKERDIYSEGRKGLEATTGIQIPCRITGMRMLADGYDTIERTILPPMRIIMPQKSVKTSIRTETIRYVLDTPSNVSLPIAHIFHNGSVCFGTVPVPRNVAVNKYLSPLDTLLGYNDRVVSHGGAQFYPTTSQEADLKQLSKETNIPIDVNAHSNWIAIDGPWVFCKRLLEKYDVQTAINYAKRLYNIMWGTPD